MKDPLIVDARGLGLGHAPRGIGRVIRELLAAFERRGDAVEVRGPAAAAAGFPRLRWRAVTTTAWRDYLSPGPFRDARRILRLAPYAPSRLDARSLVCCYDVIPLKAPGLHFPMHRRLRYPVSWHVYRHSLDTYRGAARVWTISAAVGDDIARLLGIPRERIRPVPLAAPAWAAPPAADDVVAARQRFGLPGPFLLWVLGGPNENKNVPGMFRVMAEGNLPRLCVVGGLDLYSQTRVHALAAQAGAPSPTLLGRVEDVDLRALLGAASCVVVPSNDEGFGMPVVEGLACGGVVLANDIPALREAGGDAAFYADVNQPALFAEVLRGLCRQRPKTPPLPPRSWDDVAAGVIAAADEL